MFQFTFFHSPKPREFYHKPIYWDPEAEKRQERMDYLKQKKEREEGGEYKIGIKRGSFRNKAWNVVDDKSARTERRRSNFHLLIIVAILLIVAAVLIYL